MQRMLRLRAGEINLLLRALSCYKATVHMRSAMTQRSTERRECERESRVCEDLANYLRTNRQEDAS